MASLRAELPAAIESIFLINLLKVTNNNKINGFKGEQIIFAESISGLVLVCLIDCLLSSYGEYSQSE